MATLIVVGKWVAGMFVVATVAGLGFAWKIHQANKVGGSDHDFGTKP